MWGDMKVHREQFESKTAEDQLFEAIATIKTAVEARSFLQDLCTPAEIQAMADRWRVVAMIKVGKPYRQIYDETGVSVTTVGRVARCITMGEGGYNIIYERLENKKNAVKSKVKNRHSKKRAAK